MGKSKGGKKPNGSAGPSKPGKPQGDDAILDTVSERPYSSWVAPSWFNWRVSVFFGLLAIILGFVLIRIEDLRPPSIWSTPNSKSTTANASPPKPKAATEKLLSVADIKKRSKGLPCKDRHDSNICAQMAHRGDCDEAIGWMTVMCAAACNRCEFLDPKRRCSEENMGYKFTDALKPGDLDMMFRTISERTSSEIEVVNEKPWMVLVKDFITETESSTLMNLTIAKLKRSTDQGEFSEDGFQHQVVSQHRTSSNSWCISECESNKVVMGLTQRIADLIQVPVENFESFQVLRYELGQKYDVHHDASPHDFKMPSGPRILTFFLYLSDVEEGGETNFPMLNISVKPRKGSALLWPSVESDYPNSKIEQLTYHAALPVKKGTKYAANSWIHLRNYKTPNLYGCTGSFD